MNNKICPACGSSNISFKKEIQVLKDNYGGEKEIEVGIYSCADCQTSGDFFNENEEAINKGLELLRTQSIRKVVDALTEKDFSMSSIERALGLPQRTLTKWKNGAANPSASGVALLKFVDIFPWLLDVADNKFDHDIAKRIYLSCALNEFLSLVDFKKTDNENFTATTPNASYAVNIKAVVSQAVGSLICDQTPQYNVIDG